MLEQIVDDKVIVVSASNQPVFDRTLDYAAASANMRALAAKWGQLPKLEQAKFGTLTSFLEANNADDVKSDKYGPARNYHLLSSEAQKRLAALNDIQLLRLDSIDFDDSVLELAESLENSPDIRELYKLRKKTVGDSKNAGISMEEAGRLKNCFSQGRELYIAGKNGSLMVKPLNFFYSLTAYCYGVIVLNNPLRFSKGNLPGSHGMSYLPDPVQAQIGGDTARGTFSDLLTSFPTHLIKGNGVEFNIDTTESILNFYENRYSVSLGTLLSMIPEMSEYYKLTTERDSRCFPLDIVNANDPRSVKWEFQIGNGEHRPTPNAIERAFSGFDIVERYGKVIVTVPAADSHRVKCCIYTDIRGNFWFVDNPFFPTILPEICTHFLINSIFSNIMRYRPDEWGNVLLNEVNSGISLIKRHYFSSFQRKFYPVVLRAISRYLPYVA